MSEFTMISGLYEDEVSLTLYNDCIRLCIQEQVKAPSWTELNLKDAKKLNKHLTLLINELKENKQ